jgi:hypothetical protein
MLTSLPELLFSNSPLLEEVYVAFEGLSFQLIAISSPFSSYAGTLCHMILYYDMH